MSISGHRGSLKFRGFTIAGVGNSCRPPRDCNRRDRKCSKRNNADRNTCARRACRCRSRPPPLLARRTRQPLRFQPIAEFVDPVVARLPLFSQAAFFMAMAQGDTLAGGYIFRFYDALIHSKLVRRTMSQRGSAKCPDKHPSQMVEGVAELDRVRPGRVAEARKVWSDQAVLGAERRL
jgi:hypothetical protein